MTEWVLVLWLMLPAGNPGGERAYNVTGPKEIGTYRMLAKCEEERDKLVEMSLPNNVRGAVTAVCVARDK